MYMEPDMVRQKTKAELELSGLHKDQKPIHTFASDLADVIKSGQGSAAKIAIAEANKKQTTTIDKNPISKKNIIFISIGVLLLILSILLIGYAVYKNTIKTVPIQEEIKVVTSLVRVDTQTVVDMSGLSKVGGYDIVTKILKNAKPRLNTLEQFYLVDKNPTPVLLTPKDFIDRLELKAPEELKRTLGPTLTMGVHAFSGNGPFILVQVDSYPTAFSAMLVWEQTLFQELYQLFSIDISGDRKYLFDSRFRDVVILNQDTRAIIDNSNKPVFFYTFLGEKKDLLLIATKETTLKEVVNRLTAVKVRR